MATFIPSKKEASDFNNGVQYVNDVDSVQAETINNLVESALYSQSVAEHASTKANDALNEVNKFVGTKDFPPPIGYHYIQYNGEPTPAQRYTGTSWAIDTNYQGRTIIGSGGNYNIGNTGGAEEHAMTIEEMPNHKHRQSVSPYTVGSVGGQSVAKTWNAETLENGSSIVADTESVGGGSSFSIMQPYIVANVWKRTA